MRLQADKRAGNRASEEPCSRNGNPHDQGDSQGAPPPDQCPVPASPQARPDQEPARGEKAFRPATEQPQEQQVEWHLNQGAEYAGNGCPDRFQPLRNADGDPGLELKNGHHRDEENENRWVQWTLLLAEGLSARRTNENQAQLRLKGAIGMIMTSVEIERLDAEVRRLVDAYEKGQHTSLLAEVDELSKQGPLPAGLLGLAASSLVAMERFDEAVRAARGALEREPRWAWLYLALSRAEAGRGDWAKAADAARAAVQIMPGEPGYLANLAHCQRESGQAELAVKTARQALVLDPANPESLNQLGLALETTGDPAGALEQFRQAQAVRPEDPAAYLHQGELHRRAGRVGPARRALQEALRRNPRLTEAEDRLSETLSENPLVRRVLMHLLSLARLTVVGWAIAAFLYYVLFRMLEILWKSFDVFLPVGRGLLAATLAWLVGGALVGGVLRWVLRRVG